MSISPKVGIGVLIFNENQEILLLLRNKNAQLADSEMRLEGTWTLPAGKVHFGETIFEAIFRKVKEETNLEVLEPQVFSLQDDINEYAHFVTIGCLASSYKGDILLDGLEHVAYDFFAVEKLPENLCEPSKKIIEKYFEKKIY